jgi:hypothetical protein
MSTSRWRINSVTCALLANRSSSVAFTAAKRAGEGAVLLNIFGNDITAHDQDIAVFCDHVMPGSAGQAGDVPHTHSVRGEQKAARAI